MSSHRVGTAAVFTLLSLSASGCVQHTPQRGPRPKADIVEVGYGAQPRAMVAGAIASLNAEQIYRQRATSVADLLDGIPGVRVVRDGHSISVRVRSATADPVFVIDGNPLFSASGIVLASLRPSDIERIDVLKDAGAAASYGSRGANGVVLITTKH